MDDSLIFGRVSSSPGNNKYRALIFNKEGYVSHYFENFMKFERERTLASNYEYHADIYEVDGDIFMKELYNDTLFKLTKSFELEDICTFKIGKYYQMILNISLVLNMSILKSFFRLAITSFLTVSLKNYFRRK